MRFKKDVKVMDFLNDVRKCRGDVRFMTEEGDSLNLKSQLSEYIFLASVLTKDILHKGEIMLDDATDLDYIEKYLD
ncbi:hypothetical protein SAMN04487761_10854 [Lachnospiraceae bacterium C7]|nr:hypothetical protein SAMN04487761_10854 [Lachnospiraceae bacterium C7]